MRLLAPSYLVACLLWSSCFAGDLNDEVRRNWHQWRGPLATGVAPLGNPPLEWSETKNIRWKVPIAGRGSSSPIVWNDRIFLLTAIKTDRQADDPKETAATNNHPALRLASHRFEYIAQNDRSDGQSRDELGGRERRGRGEFGRGGGFRRGLRGEVPSDAYQFVVLCIDRNSGKTLWQHVATEVVPHEGHHQTASFASASPITDGKRLFAYFGSRGIYCYDLEGNMKWGKDLEDMKMRMAFGEGASPALYEDTLVMACDQEEGSYILALDADSGEEKWRKPREEVSTWATPLIVSDGKNVQVVTSGSNRVRSYNLESGELIWECAGLGSNPIACPVVFDGLAIAMSGHHDPAGIAVPLTARGDVTGTADVAWTIDEKTPYVSSPLLYDGILYFVKSRNAVMSSVDARSGRPIVTQKRLPDMESVYASPVGANGRVYFCSREGVTNVLKHGKEFEVLATNILDEAIDASPAIVGDQLIIRGDSHLYNLAAP